MPFPWTPEELAEKLRDADPERVAWTTDAECLEAARQVVHLHKRDDTRSRRPWAVRRTALRPKVPGAPLTVFAVLRAGEYYVQESEVYPGTWELHGSNTEAKAKAIADALNALEEEAERGQEPEDVSQ